MVAGKVLNVVPQFTRRTRLQAAGEAFHLVGRAGDRRRAASIALGVEIVGTAIYLATDASAYLTGQCITLDGGGA